MQAFLIISAKRDFVENEIKKIKQQLSVTSWSTHVITPNPSIGIEEVRKIIKLLTYKPYEGINRLIIISTLEKATLEAQNALLKLLEEPPIQTYIILTAHNSESILQTVISRCQIITQHDTVPIQNLDSDKEEIFITNLLKSDFGDRIIQAAKFAKTKEDCEILLSKLLFNFKKMLTQPKPGLNLSNKDIVIILNKIENARLYINRNVNFKATLDILFLGFPKVITLD